MSQTEVKLSSCEKTTRAYKKMNCCICKNTTLKKSNTQNPVAVVSEQSQIAAERKEYLIQCFEEDNMTEDEMTEFLKLDRDLFTIENTAKTKRIDPELYKELLALDIQNVHYVYYHLSLFLYRQWFYAHQFSGNFRDRYFFF